MTATPKKKAPTSTAARQAEAEDGYASIEHLGVTLRVPLRGNILVAALDLFRDGDNYGGTKEVIGEEQWKRLKAAGLTDGELNKLGVKLRGVWGN